MTPGRKALSVVSEIEKGKSLHFQQEKAKQREPQMEEKLDWVESVGQERGNSEKWKEGKPAGGCLGVMTDVLHSVSQSVSVIS